MKRWLQQVIQGSTFQGLEIFNLDGETFYALLKLQQKNGELHLLSENVFQSIQEVSLNFDKKSALSLVVNTSQILNRQVALDSKLNLEQQVIQAFPNLDLENFHYELLETKGLGMVSIGKKEYLNELLSRLESNGIISSRVSLGISDLATTLPYLKGSQIHGSNFLLKKTGDTEFRWESHDSRQESLLELNGLKLSTRNLLSFSAVLGHITKFNNKTSLIELNKQFENGFQNNRMFDLGLKSGLGIVLVTLLINFAFYSYYREKVINMDTGHDIEQQQQQLLRAKERISQKEQRLDKVLSASSSKSTFYLDKLGLELPNTILLDGMIYQPLLKPMRDGKVIEIERKGILVSGQSSDKLQFAQWTEVLEQKKWIETVEVLSYAFTSKNLDEFTLKINIHETGH